MRICRRCNKREHECTHRSIVCASTSTRLCVRTLVCAGCVPTDHEAANLPGSGCCCWWPYTLRWQGCGRARRPESLAQGARLVPDRQVSAMQTPRVIAKPKPKACGSPSLHTSIEDAHDKHVLRARAAGHGEAAGQGAVNTSSPRVQRAGKLPNGAPARGRQGLRLGPRLAPSFDASAPRCGDAGSLAQSSVSRARPTDLGRVQGHKAGVQRGPQHDEAVGQGHAHEAAARGFRGGGRVRLVLRAACEALGRLVARLPPSSQCENACTCTRFTHAHAHTLAHACPHTPPHTRQKRPMPHMRAHLAPRPTPKSLIPLRTGAPSRCASVNGAGPGWTF